MPGGTPSLCAAASFSAICLAWSIGISRELLICLALMATSVADCGFDEAHARPSRQTIRAAPLKLQIKPRSR